MEMVNCQDSVYKLTNAKIKFNPKTDRRFMDEDSAFFATLDTLVVKAKVLISDVEFIENKLPNTFPNNPKENNFLGIPHFKFLNDVEIKNTQNLPIIQKVVFEGRFFLIGISSNNFNAIRNSKFKNQVSIKGLSDKRQSFLADCQFDSLVQISNIESKYFRIFDCEFLNGLDLNEYKGGKVSIYNNSFQVSNSSQSNPIYIHNLEVDDFSFYRNNEFGGSNSTKINEFFKVNAKNNLGIWHNKFSSFVLLSNCNVSEGRLVLGEKQTFGDKIAFHNTTFSDFSYFDWPTLKGKITGYDWIKQKRYNAETPEELDNQLIFYRIILAKQGIYNVFKKQGYRRYANEVLVEIKDHETKLWRHLYYKDKSLKNLFDWQLNVFLKEFSAYGTDPVIAIIYSLKIILLFAFFYLFFHNDWDYSSKNKTQKRFNFLFKYFQQKEGLTDIYKESQNVKVQENKDFQKLFTESKGMVPSFLVFFSKLIYTTTKLPNQWKLSLLKRIDILKGRWIDLPKSKRLWTSFLATTWFVGYLIFAFIIKLLNSLTLSINAFSTLGFGQIPTSGISRYIVILQGFMGWVLMTIFSATLISQIIQ